MLAARLPRELFEKFLALQKAPLQRDVDRLKVKYIFLMNQISKIIILILNLIRLR